MNVSGPRGASSAAARAAAFIRAPTAARPGEGDGQRAAARHAGPHRPRHLPVAAERDLRADRSGAGQGNRRGPRSAGCRASNAGRQPAGKPRQAAQAGGGRGGGGGEAAAARRSSRPIRRATASGARPTRARPGRSCPTRTSGRCTSARSASIRTTANTVYVGGVNPQKSTDGGKTFEGAPGHGARRSTTRSGSTRERHARLRPTANT